MNSSSCRDKIEKLFGANMMVCVNANKDWHSLKNNNNKKERERERESEEGRRGKRESYKRKNRLSACW